MVLYYLKALFTPIFFLAGTSLGAQSADYVLSERSTFVRDSQLISPDALSYDYPSSGVVLGNGWNVANEEKTAAICIIFTKAEVGGQIAGVKSRRIENTDTLRQELNVSYKATAKAKFGKFGGEASAKTEFLKRSRVDEHSVSILVSAQVVNGVAFVAPSTSQTAAAERDDQPDTVSVLPLAKGTPSLRLTQFARDLLGTGSPEEIGRFRAHCGDGYVSSIERGAELFAVYNLSETTSDSQDERKASVGASASYMGMSGSLDFDTRKLNQIIAKRQVKNIEYFHSAHRGLTLPSDDKSIYNSLAYLGASTSLEDSFPFRMEVKRYETLPDFNNILGDGGVYFNEEREALRQRLLGLVRYLDAVILQPKHFELGYLNIAPADLETMQDVIYDHIDDLESETRDCFDQQLSLSKALTQNCISEGARLYSDWPYRAIMPIHNDLVRDISEDEAATLDGLNAKVAKLESRWNQEIVNVARRAKRCKWGLGKGGICGHWYEKEGCKKLSHHSTCRSIRAQQNVLRTQIANIQANADRLRYHDSRYLYWIKQTSRDRRASGAIGGYLTDSELDFFRTDMLCQDPQMREGNSELCGKQNDQGQPFNRGLQDRILAGERLRLALVFNTTYRKERTDAFQAILKSDYLAASAEKQRLEKAASEEAFARVFGTTFDEIRGREILVLPPIVPPLTVLDTLQPDSLSRLLLPQASQIPNAKRVLQEVIDARVSAGNKSIQELTTALTQENKFTELGSVIEQILQRDAQFQEILDRIAIALEALERSTNTEAAITTVLSGAGIELAIEKIADADRVATPSGYGAIRQAVLREVEAVAAQAEQQISVEKGANGTVIGWERLDEIFDWREDFDLVLEEIE